MPQALHSLKAILDSDTYSEASAFMHLLAGACAYVLAAVCASLQPR